MNRFRIRFMRGEEVKFISHLDMLKVFERAVRRAGIPIAYSQGFNPHPQMVFGLPLSVGVTSDAEYADFEFTMPISPEAFISSLNSQLPPGLKVISAKNLRIKSNIMKSIVRASYAVLVSNTGSDGMNSIKAAAQAFLGQDEVLVQKEGKKGIKDVNIRPMVQGMEVKSLNEVGINDESEYNESVCVFVTADAGSVSNLKPELLVSAFNKLTGMSMNVEKIHRTALFVNVGGSICEPMSDRALTNETL